MRPAWAHDGVGVVVLKAGQGVASLVDQVIGARHHRLGVVALLVVPVVLLQIWRLKCLMLIILPEWLCMEAPRENPRRSLRQSSRSWRIPSQPCSWKGSSSECSNCCHHCGALLASTSWPSGWTGRCMGSSWPTWPCRSPPWRRAGNAWWWWEGWSSRQERLLLVGERVGKWA